MKRKKRLTRQEKQAKFGRISAWLRAKKDKARSQAAKKLNDEFKN